MLRTVDMAKSNMIFDPANGYYVPRLTADTSIPIIEKLHGKIWTPVYTVKGQEERLLQWMNQQQILAYVPKIALKEKSVQKIPFFKGVAFAALSPQMRPEVEKEFLVSDVMGIPDQDTENLVFAELVFMTMAEQISRYYPFTYEQKIPRTHKTGSSVMPMTIDGFGDCRFLSDNKNETLQMYFNFKTTDTILKFDLNFYQFRSLLLSEFLFNNKYCA